MCAGGRPVVGSGYPHGHRVSGPVARGDQRHPQAASTRHQGPHAPRTGPGSHYYTSKHLTPGNNFFLFCFCSMQLVAAIRTPRTRPVSHYRILKCVYLLPVSTNQPRSSQNCITPSFRYSYQGTQAFSNYFFRTE